MCTHAGETADMISTNTEQAQSGVDPTISRTMILAQRTYHLLLLRGHLQAIRTFLEPIVDARTFKHTEQIINLCLRGLDTMSTDLIDSILENMVLQMDEIVWDCGEPGNLFQHMEAGKHLFLAIKYKGQIMSTPMHTIYVESGLRLSKITCEATQMYMGYCRDIVFVNLIRICKLANEFKNPELAEQICQHLTPLELSNNLPYSSVNRHMSTTSRRLTSRMADMMYKVGRDVAGENMISKMTPLQDTHMKVIESFLATLTPQLTGVMTTVTQSLGNASEDELETNMADTLGECVTANLSTLLSSPEIGRTLKNMFTATQPQIS